MKNEKRLGCWGGIEVISYIWNAGSASILYNSDVERESGRS
jgi:hypothetical protein